MRPGGPEPAVCRRPPGRLRPPARGWRTFGPDPRPQTRRDSARRGRGEGQTVGVHPDDTMSRRSGSCPRRAAPVVRPPAPEASCGGPATSSSFPSGCGGAAGVLVRSVQAWRCRVGGRPGAPARPRRARLPACGCARRASSRRPARAVADDLRHHRPPGRRAARRAATARCWSVGIHDLDPIEVTAHRNGSATIEYGPDEGNERELRLLPAGSSWWPDLRPRLEMVPNGAWVYGCCATRRRAVRRSSTTRSTCRKRSERGTVEVTVPAAVAHRPKAQPSTSST